MPAICKYVISDKFSPRQSLGQIFTFSRRWIPFTLGSWDIYLQPNQHQICSSYYKIHIFNIQAFLWTHCKELAVNQYVYCSAIIRKKKKYNCCSKSLCNPISLSATLSLALLSKCELPGQLSWRAGYLSYLWNMLVMPLWAGQQRVCPHSGRDIAEQLAWLRALNLVRSKF